MDESPVNIDYTRSLPKIELHAHLTGSITPQVLHSIWQQLKEDGSDISLDDPLERLSKERPWNIQTFFPLFSSYIYALISTREAIISSTNSVLYDFWADGVIYLELRTTPRSSDSVSKQEHVAAILDCIESFEHKASMSTYLILSIDRRNTLKQAQKVVELALKFRNRGVVGIDLCGDPSKGDVSIFAPAFIEAKKAGLKVTLHFAEVPQSSTFAELETLLTFQPDRLRHVICVPEEVKSEIERRKLVIERRKLVVELCVTCNVQAGLTEDGVEGHHFAAWYGQGSPVILCTDDVGIFGSKLSNEYLLVAQHFGLNRKQLRHLCYEGIDAIFGGEHEKDRLRQRIRPT
ncbi:hypothetical protein ACLMJK_001933 [Lecanora helva]